MVDVARTLRSGLNAGQDSARALPSVSARWILVHGISVLVLTAIALLAVPYVFGAGGDQMVYLNYVARLVDPSLYPGDFMFIDNRQIDGELVSRSIAAVAGLFGSIRGVYYAVFVAAVLGHVAAYYSLVGLFLRSTEGGKHVVANLSRFQRQVTLIVLALVVVDVPMFRSFLWPMTPATVAFALMAWSIYTYLSGRYVLSVILVGIAIYANPTYAVLLGSALILGAWVRHRSWSGVGVQAGVFALLALPLLLRALATSSEPLLISQDFEGALRVSEHEGVLLLQLSIWDWLRVFVVPATAGGVLLLSARAAGYELREVERRLVWLLGIVLVMVMVSLVVVSVWPLRPIVEARPERIIIPVLLVTALGLTTHALRTLRWWESLMVLGALALGVFESSIARQLPASVPGAAVATLLPTAALGLLAVLLVRRRRSDGAAALALPDRFAYAVGAFLAAFVLHMIWSDGWSQNPAVQVPGVAGFGLLVWLCLGIVLRRRGVTPLRVSPAETALIVGAIVAMLVALNPLWAEPAWRAARRLGSVGSYQDFREGWIYSFRLVALVGGLLVAGIAMARWGRRLGHAGRMAGGAAIILPLAGAVVLGNVSHDPHPVYQWIQANTAPDSEFLVPVKDRTYARFRYWSQRSAYVVYEDRTGGLYDTGFLSEFNRRMQVQQGWERLGGQDLAGVVDRAGVDYVLAQREISAPNLQLRHSVDGEFVYAVTDRAP